MKRFHVFVYAIAESGEQQPGQETIENQILQACDGRLDNDYAKKLAKDRSRLAQNILDYIYDIRESH